MPARAEFARSHLSNTFRFKSHIVAQAIRRCTIKGGENVQIPDRPAPTPYFYGVMTERSKFFDDLAGVAGGAVSALAGLREEGEAILRARLDEMIRRLELVRRDEVDAIRELAANARTAQEEAESRLADAIARIAALESRVAALEGRAAAG